MIPVRDIVRSRLQRTVLAAILLSSVALLPVISAAEQEVPRRHSLIHRSADESADLPATIQGTILQSSSAASTGITSPIAPPPNSVSLPTMPSTHHRALIKRPAIASTLAPATSSQPLPAAVTLDTAGGQATQTTANAGKGTTPTSTAPITKMATSSPGITSTGLPIVTPPAPSPFAGITGLPSAAAAGSGSTPLPGGSRSTLNLLKNSAIAGLLQPPTPVVTTTVPPITPPLSNPSTGNVTLTWTANGEPDLAGYKIYVGTASGTYNFPGSAFLTGKVMSYTVSNLPKGQTYFFAISAYDNAGNESVLSSEVSRSLY
jgi:hypothetical protein